MDQRSVRAKSLGWVVVGLAIIWAAVILTTSNVLDGTAYQSQVLRLLGGGAAGSIIVVGGAIVRQRK